MNQPSSIPSTLNSNGAAIFKKMLEDKRAVHEHLKNGGKISDLKNQINFVKPISINGNMQPFDPASVSIQAGKVAG